MAERPEVSSQFTEDVFAKQDRYCEWPKCGALIHQGEPQYYIATIEPGQQGPAVQSDQVRTSSTNNARTDYARPDPHKIQQSVNATQRGLSINPPQVVAVSHGPDVAVPSAWHADHGPFPPARPGYLSQQALTGPGAQVVRAGGMAPTSEPITLPPRLGYTSQHSHYSQEYNQWARWSYATPPAETISLKIFAHYEGGSKWGGHLSTAFGNICEGQKDIDARISTQELVPIALDTIIPKVKMFCPMYPWRTDEFVVCDTNWVDLAAHRSPLPYFYAQCVQPVRKNPKAMSFKPKQFTLYVVVPASQWVEYEAFMDKVNSHVTTSKDVATTSSNSGDDDMQSSSVHVPLTSTSNTGTCPFHG
ncbi:hypothetical protein BKA82DRAFT_148342 [Pisolithus tinctorius]|uniref:Uncharacterized protein n=1 Tax=Pisolithus tinctorius Marx 270 TaxID=870435 RepID=A0A0C3NMF5_PISTI|nr:hypothetical protein BKA82DRAFT_148342 [Pisolithus tinctorius]KIO02085.1 hypothetical protein M404DRAFT_148342 [Pisolithus tinctorius Marx 270]